MGAQLRRRPCQNTRTVVHNRDGCHRDGEILTQQTPPVGCERHPEECACYFTTSSQFFRWASQSDFPPPSGQN